MNWGMDATTKGKTVTVRMKDKRSSLPYQSYRIEGTAVIGSIAGVDAVIGTCLRGARIESIESKQLTITNP